MELAEGAAVTHHPGERTMPQLCHRGSASQAPSSNRAAVWGGSAGKESHIPEEGREPGRGGGRLGPEVSSWPRLTPLGSPLARTAGRVLSSYYVTGGSV